MIDFDWHPRLAVKLNFVLGRHPWSGIRISPLWVMWVRGFFRGVWSGWLSSTTPASPASRVRFSDQADLNWHDILKVAERTSRLNALMDVVTTRFPGFPALTKAVEDCRGLLPHGSFVYTPRSSRPSGYPSAPVDLAVVTALAEELEPILELTGGCEAWSEFTIEGFIHRSRTLDVGGTSFTVVAHSLWKYGGDPASNSVGRLWSLQPRMFAMSGICAGWEGKDDVLVGDVVVAERAFNPSEGKLDGEVFFPDVQTFAPPPWLVQQLKDYSRTEDWQSAIRARRPSVLPRDKPKVHVATFASDAPILAIREPFKESAAQVRKVRAYDLEVKSFLCAALEKRVPAFAVKGVSDYATEAKADDVHIYAAEAAAAWLVGFVRATHRHWPREPAHVL